MHKYYTLSSKDLMNWGSEGWEPVNHWEGVERGCQKLEGNVQT